MSQVLLAIPNISEGSDKSVIAAVRDAYESAGAIVLHETFDADHGRSVHTLAGDQRQLARALELGWQVAAERIDISRSFGVHPHVGALDVAPVVFLSPSDRGAACASALAAAGSIGRGGGSVFLYGILSGGRSRASVREGGVTGLQARVRSGLLAPDYGQLEMSSAFGGTLVAARPPLIAFNLRLGAGVSLADARDTATAIREGGSSGLSGVRSLAFELTEQNFVQLSFNIEKPDVVGIGAVTEAVRERHEVISGELIGFTLDRYLAAIPPDLEMPDFDSEKKSVERCLRFHGITL